MPTPLRVLAALPALVFLLHGIGWIVQPAAVAERLGMPLLTGVGASTQIGDFASFFFVNGALIAYGLYAGRSAFLVAPACVIAGAAVFRTLAAGLGHADFAPQFIGPEVVMAGVLFVAARSLAEKE